MKVKFTVIITICLLSLFACKKNGLVTITAYVPLNMQSVTGKWNETKLVIQHKNNSTGVVIDTSFNSNAFSSTNYLQFNADSSAIYSQDNNLNAFGIGTSANGMGVINNDPKNLNFYVEGASIRISLKKTFILPAKTFPYTDFVIAELSTTDMVLNAVDSLSNSGYKNTFFIYYTKTK